MNIFNPGVRVQGLRLGDIAPIPLGCLVIKPSALEVMAGNEVRALEPRCMKVLVVLCQNEGETVTRDTLIDRCWEGRIVSDGALTRCIAQIRKVLSLDPALSVDTVARVGYRLRQSPSVASDAGPVAQPLSEPESVPPVHRKRAVMALAVLAVLGAATAWAVIDRPWRGDAVRPLTPEPGVESYPALDPKGTRLAYGKLSGTGNWDIFVRDVDGTNARAIAASPATEIWPTWRGDGQALVFVRIEGASCAIVRYDFIANTSTDATACDPARVGRPSWLDDRTLIYSDGVGGQDRRQLYTLDMTTGHKRALTSPPALAQGDMDPTLSPDGRQVVFRRTLSWGVDDLMIGDISGAGEISRVRALTKDGWKAHGVTWSSDGRDILFSSNRGGDWGLWSVPVVGGEPRRVSLGTTAITKIAGGPDNRLAIETYHPRSELRWVGNARPPYAVMADIWTPALGPSGDIAYVSNETGSAELWVMSGDARHRLTRLGASYLHSAAWSSAGDLISFVAVKDRAPQIFTIPAKGGTPVQVTSSAGDKRDLAYLAGSDRLIYLGRAGHDNQIVAADGKGGFIVQSHLGDRWSALSAGDGIVVGARTDDPWLYRLDDKDGRVLALRTAIRRPATPFGVSQDGIVYANENTLEKVTWTGTRLQLAPLPNHRMPPADIRVNTKGEVLLIDRSDNQSDISLMSLRRTLLP